MCSQLFPDDIFKHIMRLISDWKTWCACYHVCKFWYAFALHIHKWKISQFINVIESKSGSIIKRKSFLPNDMLHGLCTTYYGDSPRSIKWFLYGKAHNIHFDYYINGIQLHMYVRGEKIFNMMLDSTNKIFIFRDGYIIIINFGPINQMKLFEVTQQVFSQN